MAMASHASPRGGGGGDAKQECHEQGATPAPAARVPQLRDMTLSVYVPALCAGLSTSIVIPVLPLYALSLGGDTAAAGAVIAVQSLGAMLADGIAGEIITRGGERVAMLVGMHVRTVAALLCGLTAVLPYLALLTFGRFVSGIGLSLFQIARQTYLGANVPSKLRGRANGLVGGAMRIANIFGPSSGGMIAHWYGQPSTFLAQVAAPRLLVGWRTIIAPHQLSAPHAVCTCGATVLVMYGMPFTPPRPSHAAARGAAVEMSAPSDGFADESERRGVIEDEAPPPRRSWLPAWLVAVAPPLLQVAPVSFTFAAVRACRAMLIPLKAAKLEMSDATIGYVTAVTFAADALVFPSAGCIMDRCGRKWAGVPSLLLMSVGLLGLGWSRTLLGMLFASSLLGVGNGLSSGLVQTVGQDSAPAHARSHFMGLFKLLGDCGSFAGPLLVGAISQWYSLDSACLVVAVWSAVGAAWYGLVSKESLEPSKGTARTLPPEGEFEHRDANICDERERLNRS
ncbi:hypothetical protein AB1Y20_012866 [Prymnesium parvum]|uniref:Major facilitator superfamily (MFS) profile domain-containing protein n=1 Tax=Prymnesium parvum TaxID=97485 RepID=A0AB34IKJ9_PRYPA